MISLVIYGVVAIALASAAGYAFLNFTKTTKGATYAQENMVRLDTAAAALRAELIALPGTNGVLFAPAGVTVADGNGVTYTQVPPTLAALGFSPGGSRISTVRFRRRRVRVWSQARSERSGRQACNRRAARRIRWEPIAARHRQCQLHHQQYNGAVSNATGYVAFIVSATGAGQQIPNCASIVVSGKSVTIPNGFVRGVTADLPWRQRVAAATDQTAFYVAGSTTGDGTGRDIYNLATIDYALRMWQTLQPRQTDIYLQGALAYTIPANTSTPTSANPPLDLDAEAPYTDASGNVTITNPFAQGQNLNLVIETLPGSGTPATLAIGTALTLTTATSFINLNLEAASALTAISPLTMRNVTYAANPSVNPDGSANNPALSVIGTVFAARDVSFSNTTLAATNSTVEFYNDVATASTMINTQLNGSMSQFGFDGIGGAGFTFSAMPPATIRFRW